MLYSFYLSGCESDFLDSPSVFKFGTNSQIVAGIVSTESILLLYHSSAASIFKRMEISSSFDWINYFTVFIVLLYIRFVFHLDLV